VKDHPRHYSGLGRARKGRKKRNATNGYVDIADRRFDLAWINGNQIGAS
jgi:hypothetical protein